MKSLFVLLLMATGITAFAQPSEPNENTTSASSVSVEKIGVIQGIVLDKNLGSPLSYVTVVIENTKGEILTGGITDEEGKFLIKDIPTGQMILKIQYIGYKSYSKEIHISRDNNSIELGTITLEEDIASLAEVTVVGERSTIVQKIDRKVITVGRDLTTTGASAAEIMNNIPSVNVDQNGSISLRGNSNVRVLVDGKPTNIDPAQLLQQIPSTSIKSIELITNPSAKYNPEGMSGIINIVLHKNMNDGFNGDITLGLQKGEYAKFNSSINLNYRKGKFNFYTNYGARAGNNLNLGDIRRFDNPSTPNFNESSTESFSIVNNRKSHLFKFGVDYFINDRNTLSVYTNQNIYNGKTEFNVFTAFLVENISESRQNTFAINDSKSETYNLAYKHIFEKEGHEILLEANYNTYESDEDTDFRYLMGSRPDYMDFAFADRENTTINLDYTNPLSEDLKLELGVEARIQKTDNDYSSTNNSLQNSDFFYDRYIYSGYATYSQKLGKWSYQLGARLENYKVEASFNAENQEPLPFEDDIFTVYPSGFLTYAPNEKNTYQLSFSRRVDRPGVEQINPIREFSSPLINARGNQQLVPQYTNSVELNYTRQLGKGNITAGVFYRMIKDEIGRSIQVDPLDPAKLLLSYSNFEDNNAYGFEVSANYKPLSFWSFNASFDLYQQSFKSVLGTEAIEVDNTAYTFRINNSLKATKDLTFQVFGLYRGPQDMVQFSVEEMYFVNTGVRYNVMGGNATISFNYNDIFDTQRSKISSDRPVPLAGEFSWESQAWYVGLSYRFGDAKKRNLARKNRDDNEASGGGLF